MIMTAIKHDCLILTNDNLRDHIFKFRFNLRKKKRVIEIEMFKLKVASQIRRKKAFENFFS